MNVNDVDISTGTVTVREETPEEQTERETAEQQLADSLVGETVRREDAGFGIDRIAEIPGVRKKLKAVASGSDTLSSAQLQRLVAAIALNIIRDRDDT